MCMERMCKTIHYSFYDIEVPGIILLFNICLNIQIRIVYIHKEEKQNDFLTLLNTYLKVFQSVISCCTNSKHKNSTKKEEA